jgi:hypothetical protein
MTSPVELNGRLLSLSALRRRCGSLLARDANIPHRNWRPPRRRIPKRTRLSAKTSAATPDWAGDKQKRLAKIQQTMAALEADARLAAAEERRIEAEKEQQRQAEGRKSPIRKAAS